ncbi:translation elongation factor 2 (EF-2/EF-G) [Mobilisporobacter senegalensis]|uniref:Translation elongation factor 2 (EF-2/EF-G) n=1 Tax=Mobilisporobacter senegalensis TaxID=1329262 RepID=A0A3N1XK84_9FIRM|nr:elongation factor G [Mobilisporobacter senegalensis]ROR27145.1 translation elongation factor 2 (EF-2/EF-G) [Mobilisporobacter senegalensis]
MDVYTSEKIRNVVLLGHGSCGKTTLVEAMAYTQGITKRQGKIEEGNTISDYDKEEAKRLFSISTSVVPIIWEDTKINILDTPGYFDFIGEVEEALSAADAAVIVISAKAGVEVGTLKAWDYCEKYHLPRMFFVTDMDDDNASYRGVIDKLTENYGKKIAPFHLPIRENEKFVGFVNVVKMAGRRFTKLSEYEECPIPDYSEHNLAKYREALLDAVAETSDELMDKYFNGEEFTGEEISQALRNNVIDGSIVPVLMGSGLNAQGTTMLLQAIEKYFPAPSKREIAGLNIKTGETFKADYNEALPMTAKVFKTIADPFIGKFSLIKVCSGILKSDAAVYNTDKDTEEKLSRLYMLRGKEQIEVKELHAGDIGAIGKLSTTATGDTLATKSNPIAYEKPELSRPYTYQRFKTRNKGDDDKVSQALAKMMDEDLTLKVGNDKENRQTLLYGIGEQHLEVAVSKLLMKYKVEIDVMKPKVPYRETIRGKVKIQGKYKKQSGGHGQYGDVHMEFEPSGNLEEPYVFEEKIFGGAVPRNYFPAVEKGIAESVLKGPLAGYPVVGIKATLVDGSYHPVDSSEMAFKMATIQAFKQGILDAKPVLLEPIATMKVIIPDRFTGDIMGDLNKRRGRVLGMNPLPGGKQEIVADIPISETFGYSTELRSMTGGIGEYSYEFNRYEQAPSDIQEKVIEESAKRKEEAEE